MDWKETQAETMEGEKQRLVTSEISCFGLTIGQTQSRVNRSWERGAK